MGYYKKRKTDWRTNKNYQNRFRKNQPVEHPLGSWANPYPAGPFDPNNIDKITINLLKMTTVIFFVKLNGFRAMKKCLGNLTKTEWKESMESFLKAL